MRRNDSVDTTRAIIANPRIARRGAMATGTTGRHGSSSRRRSAANRPRRQSEDLFEGQQLSHLQLSHLGQAVLAFEDADRLEQAMPTERMTAVAISLERQLQRIAATPTPHVEPEARRMRSQRLRVAPTPRVLIGGPQLSERHDTREARGTERMPRTEEFRLANEIQQEVQPAEDMRRFDCPICFDTLEDPAGCGRCSGRFCLSCLNQMANVALDDNRGVSCPTCRRPPEGGTFQKDTRLKEEIERAQVAQQVAEQVARQVAQQVTQQAAQQGPHLFLERICQSLEIAAGTARDPLTTEPSVRFSSFRENNHCSVDISVGALRDDETGRDLVKKAQEKSAERGDGVFAFTHDEVRKAKSGDAKLFFVIRQGRCFTRAEFFELTRAQMLAFFGGCMVLPVTVCLQEVDKSWTTGVNMDEW